MGQEEDLAHSDNLAVLGLVLRLLFRAVQSPFSAAFLLVVAQS
jgi:hypothetical protein